MDLKPPLKNSRKYLVKFFYGDDPLLEVGFPNTCELDILLSTGDKVGAGRKKISRF